MSEVQQVRTRVAMPQVLTALRKQWRALMRQALRSDVAALLLALVDLETRAGNAAWNWNLGNFVETGDGPYFVGDDSGNTRRFTAYASLQAGAKGFVRQLTRPERKQWAAGLMTGNPERFVAALGGKHGGPKYFEAKFARYRKTFLQRWRRYATSSGSGGPVLLLLSAAALGGAVAYALR